MSKADQVRKAMMNRGKIKHVGFQGAEDKVENEGYSKQVAAKIIASTTRKASAAAKANNPRLARVK